MEEEILDIEVEETTNWIKRAESLSKEAKKDKIRDLLEYRDSDSFLKLKSFCKAEIVKINQEVYNEAYSREKCEATNSILDSYVTTSKATKHIASEVGNETFKNYLIESRIGALDSAIMFKI